MRPRRDRLALAEFADRDLVRRSARDPNRPPLRGPARLGPTLTHPGAIAARAPEREVTGTTEDLASAGLVSEGVRHLSEPRIKDAVPRCVVKARGLLITCSERRETPVRSRVAEGKSPLTTNLGDLNVGWIHVIHVLALE
jgi:hypothetical protein